MVDDNSGGNNIFLCRMYSTDRVPGYCILYFARRHIPRIVIMPVCALKTKIRKIIVTPPQHHHTAK